MKLHRIDDEISVDYNESRQTVGVYDNRDSSPPRIITVLTDEQMWAINDWWMDGRCICGNEIPQYDYLCSNCLHEAIAIQLGHP